MKMPRCLTIAGSDSGGGAGIQADLKTFAALGVYGMSALTAITAQNTLGVQGVYELPADFVGLQIDSVVTDIGVDAVKTGMLANAEIITVVAAKVQEHHLPNLVVDPVMVAKSGDPLLRPEAREALIRLLLPLAVVVTPNLHEARVLTGMDIQTVADMERAAVAIHQMGGSLTWWSKGGHLSRWGQRGRPVRRGALRPFPVPTRGDEEHPRDGLHFRLGHRGGAGEGGWT
jgi:hydroxymethylpyrimidine/phosphomethylpyrimidine kinase